MFSSYTALNQNFTEDWRSLSSMKTLKVGGERTLRFWAERAGKQGSSCTGNSVTSKCGFSLNQNKTPRVSKFPLKWKFWEFWSGNAEAGCFWYPPPAPDLRSETDFLVSLQPCRQQLPRGGGRFPGGHLRRHLPGSLSKNRAFVWKPSSLLGFLGVAQLGPGGTSGGWKGCVRKTEDGGGWWRGRRTSFVSWKKP